MVLIRLRGRFFRLIGKTARIIRYSVVYGFVDLWGRSFWQAWDQVGLQEKAIWIFFFAKTIAIITLIQVLLLKK